MSISPTSATSIRIELPLRLVSELNARGHWAKRHTRLKVHRNATRLSLARLPAWPLRMPVEIVLTRIAPRRLDSDNLAASCKGVRDGVADALGVDDGADCVRWVYAQQRGAARQYGVIVEVRER